MDSPDSKPERPTFPANGDKQSFNSEYECVTLRESIDWLILPQALEIGRQSEGGRDPQRGRKQAKRKVEDRLKMTDQW